MKKLEAVIFDLDGTIVHSEDNYFLADKVFVESHGGIYTDQDRERFTGMGSKPFVELIKSELGLKNTVQDLLIEKDEAYLKIARGNTQAFPEMVKLIKALVLQGVPLAVASGSSLHVIEETLTMVGLRQNFDHLVSSESVAHPKPDPHVFLEAAQRMKVNPLNALVLEDSPYGIEAAKAAGMACIAVPYIYSPGAESSYRKADLYLGGINEFTAEIVLDWIDGNYCQCEDCSLYDLGRCQE